MRRRRERGRSGARGHRGAVRAVGEPLRPRAGCSSPGVCWRAPLRAAGCSALARTREQPPELACGERGVRGDVVPRAVARATLAVGPRSGRWDQHVFLRGREGRRPSWPRRACARDRDAAARLDGNAGASPCSPASCRGARCRPRPRPRPGGTHGGPAPAPRVWGRGLPAPLSRCDRGPSGAAVPGSHLLVSDVINTCRGNRFGKVEEIGCFGKLNLWCL